MPQIDPKIAERRQVFDVLEAISVQFPRDFVISFNTTYNEGTSYNLIYFEKYVAAFCLKNTSERLQFS